jgi:hypothetical protein
MGNRYHRESLTKFAEAAKRKSYHSFDAAGYHFVILDACFTGKAAPYGRKNFHWGDVMRLTGFRKQQSHRWP